MGTDDSWLSSQQPSPPLACSLHFLRVALARAAAVGLSPTRPRSLCASRLPPAMPCVRPLASGSVMRYCQTSEGGRPPLSTSLEGREGAGMRKKGPLKVVKTTEGPQSSLGTTKGQSLA